MKRLLLPSAVLLSLSAPASHARGLQQVAVGARVGSLGIGADVSVPVYDRIAVRGAAGLLGFDLDLTGRFGLDPDRTARLTLPTALYTLGADVRLGDLHVGAGVLFRSGDPAYRVTLDPGANIVIGRSTYKETEVKTLTTTLSSGAVAPYVALGFGSHLSPGFSFAADIGVALPVGVELTMAATGDETLIGSSSFRTNLALKETQTNDDAGGFVNYWPIVSVGLRYGLRLGGRRH